MIGGLLDDAEEAYASHDRELVTATGPRVPTQSRGH